MSRISPFKYIDFETCSLCNRMCPTCIRNSHPDRDKLQSWFEPHLLSTDIIRDALDQCIALGFRGGVCLSHYNEPLMDERIMGIARMVKSYGVFSIVFLNTNGDFINERMADELDGSLDRIIVSLYMKEPIKSERAKWIESLFHKTEVQIILQSDHITTHFSPKPDLALSIENNQCHPCSSEPQIHLIINHRRQYLLCCDDVIGNFDLGTFPEMSIEEYWYGKKHSDIVENLAVGGSRLKYPYCSICPRP